VTVQREKKKIQICPKKCTGLIFPAHASLQGAERGLGTVSKVSRTCDEAFLF
jgi:hypothetical protein